MEPAWKEEDQHTWPTKEEVRIFLKTTNKTIERWQKNPEMLRRVDRLLTGHKRIPIYNPVDVLRIKAQKTDCPKRSAVWIRPRALLRLCQTSRHP